MIRALEALKRLQEGNRRFLQEDLPPQALPSQERRRALADGQNPFAIILGCSDSRGNIVAPSQIGSVEFAADRFGTRRVVVLGHSRCGAVQATLEELGRPKEAQSKNLMSIVDRIRPSVEPLLGEVRGPISEDLMSAAVRANVHASVLQLRHGSPILENLVQSSGLLVVGAEYSLETGQVEFFDTMGGDSRGYQV